MSGTIGISRGCPFFIRILSASARRPRGGCRDGWRGEGTEYLSTIIIAACVMYHVVLQAVMVASIYIYICTYIRDLSRRLVGSSTREPVLA